MKPSLRSIVEALGNPGGLHFRGWCFFFLSVLLLRLGLVREELFAALWGGAFLAVTVYVWLSVQITAVMLTPGCSAPVSSRARSGCDRRVRVALALSEAGMVPGASRDGEVHITLPRLLPPAVRTEYLLRLTWHGVTMQDVVRLRAGEQRVQVRLYAPCRGQFEGPEGYLVISDLLGLAARKVTVPGEREIRVYPELRELKQAHRSLDYGGEHSARKLERRRSDELVESRPYVPGDDPRRLNWKLYAHLGELLVRLGEHAPPPSAALGMVLDTARGPDWEQRSGHRYLDRLIAVYCAAALRLLEAGRALTLWWPGLPAAVTLTAQQPERLLWHAAALWWDERPADSAPELLAGFNAQRALVFAPVGSPRAGALIRELQARGTALELLICEYPRDDTGEPDKVRSLASRLLLREGARLEEHAARMPRQPVQPAEFSRRLHSDILRYSRDEWSLDRVASV